MAFHPRKPGRPDGTGRFLCADLEAVGLLHQLRRDDPTSMHVIGVQDLKTGESWLFFDPYENRDPENREVLEAEGQQDGYLIDGVEFLLEAEAIVFHNYTGRSEEHTSELQSRPHLVCRLLLEKKNKR